jgi:replicative DNA helicase
MGDLAILNPSRSATMEATALGLALGDPEHLATLCSDLVPEDYGNEHHAQLHRLLLQRFTAGHDCDFVAIMEDVVRRGDSRFGGAGYVADLLDSIPSHRRSMGPVVASVKDAATRRRLVEVAQMALELAKGRPVRVEGVEVLADSGAHAADVVSQQVSALLVPDARHEWHAGEARRMELIERDRAIAEGRYSGGPISTGLDCLDEVMGGGPKRQDLVILGGRPGMGKTALALSMSLEMACEGRRVGYLPMEMRASQLDLRAIGYLSGYSPRDIEQETNLGQGAWDDITDATEMYEGLPLEICDRPQLTLAQVVSQARRWKATGGPRRGRR